MKLALSVPMFGEIQGNTAVNFPTRSTTLGSAVTTFGEVAIYIGGFLMFMWAAWGVFDYLRAEGNKEALTKARKRIQWAIVGFIILLLSFFLSDYLRTTLNPGEPNLTKIELRK
jgi:hypothetical protein